MTTMRRTGRAAGVGLALAVLGAALAGAAPAGAAEPSADVGVTLTRSPNLVELDTGDLVTYTATVTNAGPDTAQDVLFLDSFTYDSAPAQVESVETTVGTCSVIGGGQTASCQLGDLASGASAVVTVEAQFFDAGVFDNTVSIASATPDPVVANDQATAPVVVIPGPPFETRIVNGYFTELLGRAPTPAELAVWGTRVTQVSPVQFTTEILRTNTYKKRYVNQMFQLYLGRPADAGAQAFYLTYLNSGKRYLQLVATLLGSNEAYAKAGNDYVAWYTKTYRALTGDAPPAVPVPASVGPVTAGQRAAVAGSIMNSAEGRRKFIDRLFRTHFGRGASQFDLYVGLSDLNKPGATFESVEASVLGSYSYYRKFLFSSLAIGGDAFVPERASTWKEPV